MKGKKVLKMTGRVLLIIIVVLGAATAITQWMAKTPEIKDENGKRVKGSIAELRKVKVNGHKEWITIRGWDQTKPVLLFLAGGPGGTQLGATRYELSELEKDFIVVNWDQPGSGKSFHSMNKKNITVDTYIEDGIAVTEYLRERFHQEKIYLVGESWGSALGIFLAGAKPEYYAGVVGTGQMVDFAETEKIDYDFVMQEAEKKGNMKLVNKLKKQGPPVYTKGNIAMKSATYLGYITNLMVNEPNIHNAGYKTFRDMFASEYGLMDSVNYMLGLLNTFNVVYPQLYDIDLRKDYKKIDVPVYFFLGRYDYNAPTELAEEYYEILEAPKKEIVWFEHAGHSVWQNEPEVFMQELKRAFLNQ